MCVPHPLGGLRWERVALGLAGTVPPGMPSAAALPARPRGDKERGSATKGVGAAARARGVGAAPESG